MYIKRFTDSGNNEEQNEDENINDEALSGNPEDELNGGDDIFVPDVSPSMYPEEKYNDLEQREADSQDFKKKREEIRKENAREKEIKRREKFNYVKVEDIDRSNPEINDYVSNVLVPGLMEFTKSTRCRYSLIRLFHNLGCSASFVFALAGVFHDVAHALQMAVESSEDKIISEFQDDIAKAERIIVCYRRMYNKFDRSTIFAFNKEDKWHEHHEPLNFISFISPFKFQRTYEQ